MAGNDIPWYPIWYLRLLPFMIQQDNTYIISHPEINQINAIHTLPTIKASLINHLSRSYFRYWLFYNITAQFYNINSILYEFMTGNIISEAHLHTKCRSGWWFNNNMCAVTDVSGYLTSVAFVGILYKSVYISPSFKPTATDYILKELEDFVSHPTCLLLCYDSIQHCNKKHCKDCKSLMLKIIHCHTTT